MHICFFLKYIQKREFIRFWMATGSFKVVSIMIETGLLVAPGFLHKLGTEQERQHISFQ